MGSTTITLHVGVLPVNLSLDIESYIDFYIVEDTNQNGYYESVNVNIYIDSKNTPMPKTFRLVTFTYLYNTTKNRYY